MLKKFPVGLLLLTTTILLSTNNASAKDDPNTFVDVARSLTKQEAAAKDAEKVVKAGVSKLKEVLLLLQDKAAPVRDTVVLELEQGWSNEDLAKLSIGFKSKSPLIIEGLAEVYETKKVKAGVPSLVKALSLKNAEDAVVACLRALAAIGDDSVYKKVEKTYKRERKNFRIRGEALRTMAYLSKDKSASALKDSLGDRLVPVRIMALVILSEQDSGAGINAVGDCLASLDKVRDELWQCRVLFACLDILRGVEKRSAYKAEYSKVIPQIIARLKDAKGREEWEIGQTLCDLSGDLNRAPDYESWKYWWEANQDKWEPKDKPQKKKSSKSKKDKDKKEEAKAPERASGSTVSFHGVPIHSKRLTFVQDISGGMKNPVGGRGSDTPPKLQISKEELNKVIGQLSEDTYVNLTFFATFYYTCAPAPLPIKKFREKLQAFTRQQEAPTKRGHGRSNLYDSIANAIKQDNIDTVFVLTEGGPSEGKYLETSRFVKHMQRLNVFYRARVHTMLMTASKAPKATKFLQTVAESTGGSFYDLKKLRNFDKAKK